MTSLPLLLPLLLILTRPDATVAYSSPAQAGGGSLDPACTSMTPGHGMTLQTSLPPYDVTFTPTTFTPGVTSAVRVTIKACGSLSFKGFLIQARRADTAADQAALGRFQTVTNTQRTCSLNNELTSLSHATSDAKTSLSFDWFPGSVVDHVVFRVTFVQSFTIVWADIKSQILVASNIAAPSGSSYVSPTPVQSTCSQAVTQAPVTQAPGTQAPVTQAPVTSVTSDPGCGTTRGCYDDCQSGNGCSFQISWFEDGNNGEYKIVSSVASASAWIAVGFSDDNQMGNDSVMGCASSTGGQVYGFNALNTGKSPPTVYDDNGVALISNSLTNDVLTCTFRRTKTEGSDGKRFDVTLPWNLLFAKGSNPQISSQQVTGLSYHFATKSPSTLQYRVGSVTGQNAAATPAPPAPQGVTKEAACGSTKGCFSQCTGDSCNFVVSWREDGDDAEFTLTSSSSDNGYLALGLSSDSKMGSDDVLGCAVKNNVVVKFSSKNGGKNNAAFDDNELQLVSSTFADNILRCTLKRPKTGTAAGGESVVTAWTYLFARGSTSGFSGDLPTISYHGASNRFISSQAFMISDLTDSGAASTDRKLVKLHGSLMVLAWVFMASLGVLMPRYFKSVWLTNMCDQKVWFMIHRTCMTFVMLLTIGGFVAIWVEIEEFSELEDKKHLEAHPIMGTVVMGLTLLNPIMALFRPHPGTANRKYFNFFHWLVGSGGYTLAIVTVYFGVLLEVADVPHFIFYVLIAYSSWQFFAEVSMGIASACCRTSGRKEQYELNDDKTGPAPATDKPISVESEQGLLYKKVMLALHIVCTLAFTAVIIVVIVIGEVEWDKEFA